MPRMPILPVPALLASLSFLGSQFFACGDNPPFQTKFARAGENLAQNGRTVLGLYCSGCHNQGRAKIDLDDSLDLTQHQDRSGWEKVVKLVRAGEMPPPAGKWPQPSHQERQILIHWIEHEFLREGPKALAGVRSRRLQRNEYVNVIRDLVGVSFHPASDFPEDDHSWKRELPTLSPHLLEKYQSAAEQILHDFLIPRTPPVLAPPCDDEEDDDLEEACADHSKEEQARDFIVHFAYRAFRRPLVKGELKDLMAHYRRAESSGLGYEESLKAALLSVLTAPQFLFRIEAVGSTTVPSARDRQFELASRLSFFLWSSTPDDELLAAADQELLAQDLQEQAKRLLRDPRTGALAADFANSWLELGKLDSFPDEVIQAAHLETQQFIATILNEDRSVLELLDADYTFLNEPLAKHYGIGGVEGLEVRRVSLAGKQRGGLVTQASILRLMGIEASPVKRGKWVLENLLGSPPLAPPSGLLQALAESRRVFEPGTLRQLMEKHRSNASCSACHAKMDALGIALENFDGEGSWRTKANGLPVDAVGTLPGGETINGPDQLKTYLLGKKDLFVRSLSGKLLGYALGRKLDKSDLAALDSIPSRAAREHHRFSSVLLAVIQSGPFQNGLASD